MLGKSSKIRRARKHGYFARKKKSSSVLAARRKKGRFELTV